MPKRGTQFQSTSASQTVVAPATAGLPPRIQRASVRRRSSAAAASEIQRGNCVLQRAVYQASMPATSGMTMSQTSIMRTPPTPETAPSRGQYRPRTSAPVLSV